jgi:hypothetical protein
MDKSSQFIDKSTDLSRSLKLFKKNKDFASSVNKICDRNPLQFATTLKPCGRLNYLTKKFLFAITKALPYAKLSGVIKSKVFINRNEFTNPPFPHVAFPGDG